MSLADATALFRPTKKRAENEISAAIRSLRPYLIVVGIFSSVINLLYLSSPLYLMQVYNRVLISESIPTLVLLTLVLVLALLVMAILMQSGPRCWSDVVCCLMRNWQVGYLQHLSRNLPRRAIPRRSSFTELDDFRTFVTGPGIHFAFDVPPIPIYLGPFTLFTRFWVWSQRRSADPAGARICQ